MRADGAEEPLTIESFTLPASDLGVKEEGDSSLLLSFSSILYPFNPSDKGSAWLWERLRVSAVDVGE